MSTGNPQKNSVLLLLIFSHFTVDLYGSFLAPLQPFLAARHHLALVQAGFLVSLFSISASLLQPVYGYWSDRLGRRFFVVLAPLIAASFMCLLPLAPKYGVVMLFLFLGGIGVASFHPQASSMSHLVSGPRKGLGMSLFISGGNFGTALGPLYILWIVNRFGLDSTYLAVVPAIALTVALFFVCPDLPKRETVAGPRSVFREVRKFAGSLGSLYTIVVLRTLVQLSFLTYIPIFLKQMNLSPLRIGTAITAFAAAGAVGGMIAGALFDRIGGRKLFLLSALISPIFLLLTAQTKSPDWLILWFSLAGLFLMMTIPISVLMGQTIVPGAISTVSSLMMGFGWGMGGLLVPLVGWAADHSSIPSTLRFLAVVPLLFLALAWRLPGRVLKRAIQHDASYSIMEA